MRRFSLPLRCYSLLRFAGEAGEGAVRGARGRLLRSQPIPASPCDLGRDRASLFRRGIPRRMSYVCVCVCVLYACVRAFSLVQIKHASPRRWIGSLDRSIALSPEEVFKQQPCQLPALFDLPLPSSPPPPPPAAAAASPPLPPPSRPSSRALVSPLSFSRACERPRKLYLYPPAARARARTAVARLSLSRARRRCGCRERRGDNCQRTMRIVGDDDGASGPNASEHVLCRVDQANVVLP